MASCDLLLENIDASCLALNKMGGVRKKIYYVPTEDIESAPVEPTDGTISGITLKAGKKMFYIESKKFVNNGTHELQTSENGPKLFNQNVTIRAFYETQMEKNAIEKMALHDGLTFFVPRNSGKVEAYGLSKEFESNGLSATTSTGGTGTLMGDDTSIVTTFTGPEHNLPVEVLIGDDMADTLAALDALVTPVIP